MATARKKSLRDLQAQYDRILAGDKQYMQPDENGALQGRSARTERAANALERYRGNILDSKTYKEDSKKDGKVWDAYVRGGYQGDRSSLNDQTRFDRKYSQRVYMGGSVG